MKILKYPMANAFYIAITTVIYALVFLLSANYLEECTFIATDNWWSTFIHNGNMKYVGLGMLVVAAFIDTISALRRKGYDEYQISRLEKNLIFNGIFAMSLLPIIACALLIFHAHSIEAIFAFMIFQWLINVIANFIYLSKNYVN